jgi:molybdopterin molybdotransferase
VLSVKEALDHILSAPELTRLSQRGSEQVRLTKALGRRLSEDQVASVNVPPWDNSAMDGYALCLDDLLNTSELTVSQTITAGMAPEPLANNSCARIFTGAPIPQGADTVIMQENASQQGEVVTFSSVPERGANIRKQAEDIAAGTTVVRADTLLQSAHLGLLASVGIASVPVQKKLRVALFSTGDELLDPLAENKQEMLAPGKIYNSNRYLLHAMLQQLDCEVVDGGMVGDDRQKTEEQLRTLSCQADMVISTGGVSVGDEDHVKAALEKTGELNVWKIALKPGKPLAFGYIGTAAEQQTIFFGLPGNPVSAFVTFLLFVKPALLTAQGYASPRPRTLRAVADFDWPRPDPGGERKPLKREEYLRARLQEDSKRVEIFADQGSATLSSLAWANCLAIVPLGELISCGDEIEIVPL